MKKNVLTLLALILLVSCNEKPKESANEKVKKTETKAVEVVKEITGNTKEFKTRTGKTFIVKEEKPSASISKITVIPKGFSEVNEALKMEESDPFDYAFVADVNGDGFDELYIVTRGTGSGSYATIYGFSSNSDKSVTPIYVPELSVKDLDKFLPGYMGHDKFYVEGNKLLRKYPVYKKGDSQNNPTGGEKVVEYVLIPGEATWILELKK